MVVEHRRTRRVVAWVDHSVDGAVTTRWAAQHAAARRLPLHLMQFPHAPADASGDGSAETALGTADLTAAAALALKYALRRVRVRQRDLEVTTQIVLDGGPRPGPDSLRHGDLLVTGMAGYIDLAEHTPATSHLPATIGAPIVVVPLGDAPPVGAGRGVVLLTGALLSEQAAAFAFETAADLGTRVDVVQWAVNGTVFGVDDRAGPARAADRVQYRVRGLIDGATTRHPAPAWTISTLRSTPWRAFRTVTRAAQLTVLPDPAEPDENVRRLLGIAACPLALVPTTGAVR
ncbi:MAG TPA: hypothetical protein VL551_32215 [Actinospica sp.]|jgi:hypothetical protein|nr:hypothetical protein [Actinospica sp.]